MPLLQRLDRRLGLASGKTELGDMCLAETPSALCNVWNHIRHHIPSAVTNRTGHFCHFRNLGFKKHQKDPRELQITSATPACPVCPAILLFFVRNAHSWINLIFHVMCCLPQRLSGAAHRIQFVLSYSLAKRLIFSSG